METLDNIVRENNIKIVILNETHLPANRPPVLRGFKTYSRARVGKRMGGVAVLVAKEFDNGAVKIESGDGDLEYDSSSEEEGEYNAPAGAIPQVSGPVTWTTEDTAPVHDQRAKQGFPKMNKH